MLLNTNTTKPLNYTINLIYSDYYKNLYSSLKFLLNKPNILNYGVKYTFNYLSISLYFKSINYFLVVDLISSYYPLNDKKETFRFNISFVKNFKHLQNLHKTFNTLTIIDKYIEVKYNYVVINTNNIPSYVNNFLTFNIKLTPPILKIKVNYIRNIVDKNVLIFKYLSSLIHEYKIVEFTKAIPKIKKPYVNIYININIDTIINKIINLKSGNITIQKSFVANYHNKIEYNRIITFKPLTYYNISLTYSDFYINKYTKKLIINEKIKATGRISIRTLINNFTKYLKIYIGNIKTKSIDATKTSVWVLKYKISNIINFNKPLNFYHHLYFINRIKAYNNIFKIGISKFNFDKVYYPFYNIVYTNQLRKYIPPIQTTFRVIYFDISNFFEKLDIQKYFYINLINSIRITTKAYTTTIYNKFIDLLNIIYQQYLIQPINIKDIYYFNKFIKYSANFKTLLDLNLNTEYQISLKYEKLLKQFNTGLRLTNTLQELYTILNKTQQLILGILKINFQLTRIPVKYVLLFDVISIRYYIFRKIFHRFVINNNNTKRFIQTLQARNQFIKIRFIRINLLTYITTRYQRVYRNIKNIKSTTFSLFNKIFYILKYPLQYYQLFSKITKYGFDYLYNKIIINTPLKYLELFQNILKIKYYYTVDLIHRYSSLRLNININILNIPSTSVLTTITNFGVYVYNFVFKNNKYTVINSIKSYINYQYEIVYYFRNILKRIISYNTEKIFVLREQYTNIEFYFNDRYNVVKPYGIYTLINIFADFYLDLYKSRIQLHLFRNYLKFNVEKLKVYIYENEIVRLKKIAYIQYIYNQTFNYVIYNNAYIRNIKTLFKNTLLEKVIKNRTINPVIIFNNIKLFTTKYSSKHFLIDYSNYLRRNINHILVLNNSKTVKLYLNMKERYFFNTNFFRYLNTIEYNTQLTYMSNIFDIIKSTIVKNIVRYVLNRITVEYSPGDILNNFDGLTLYNLYK